MRRVINLLVAMASVGLLGILGTGAGLVRGNHVADAQTVSRPNFVVVMTDDLDNQSMEQFPNIATLMGSNGVKVICRNVA